MLIGRAVWSVCFDRLFSYHAVKTKFEQEHFRVHDAKTYAQVNSQGELNFVSHAEICNYDQNWFYWGLG